MGLSNRIRLATAVFGFTMLTLAAPAHAGDLAAAETLFNEGQAAMKKEDWAGACRAFEASNAADPSIGAQVNLARCSEKQGKLATAWGAYNEAARLAAVLTPPQPERGAAAKAEAEKLVPKLQKLQVKVLPIGDDIQVKRDGVPMTQGVAIPVDPGKHVIEVTAKGKKPKKEEVTVVAGQKALYEVQIGALEDAPPEVVAGGNAGGSYRSADAGPDPGATQRTIAYITGGVGILALIGAGGLQLFNVAVTDSKRKDDEKDYQRDCPQGKPGPTTTQEDCDARAAAVQSKKDAASSNQTAAIVIGAVGLAALGTGIVLLVTAPSHKTGSTKPTIVPRPEVGPGYGGFSLTGTF